MRRRIRPIFAGSLALGMAIFGCSTTPRARRDESLRVSQTLQEENNRLKDVVFNLRARNEDLVERSVDDARKLRAAVDVNQRLERSIIAYQEDRERLAKAYDEIKRRIAQAASGSGTPAAMLDRFQGLARSRPEIAFDRGFGVLSIQTSALFETGTAKLKPNADETLRPIAAALASESQARSSLDILITGRGTSTGVVRTNLAGGSDSPGAPLSPNRAAAVRDRLVALSGIEPARFGVAAFDIPEPIDGADSGSLKRIEIRVRVDDDSNRPENR
jgi:flagellar motor protein MotB